VAIKTESTYISDSMIDITAISTASLGFSTTPSATKLTPAIATMTDNWKLQYGRFARQSRNSWQSVVVAIIWLILCRAQQSRIWRGNLDAI